MTSWSRLVCKSLMVACALLGGIAARAQELSLDPGIDRMGGDYKGFAVGDDPVLCQRACAADDACRAFTFVRPGIQQASAMCYLKSSVPPASANACCTSGVRSAPTRRTQAIALTPALAMPQARTASPPSARAAIAPAVRNPMRATASDLPSLLPPPFAASLRTELEGQVIAWQWTQHGCFPDAAGAPPTVCPFVQGLDGFRIYRLGGGLAKTVSDPMRREVTLGAQKGACYLVVAFKGDIESGPSPAACEADPPPHPLSTELPVPNNLRSTTDPKACAAAAGDPFTGLICDAAMKNNAQPLLWDLAGGGIDGFHVYDAYQGVPVLVKAEANPKLRVFMIEPAKGVVLNDSCFTVRSYKGEVESLPSNPVCLTPKGPVPPPQKPALQVPPASGILVTGVELLKNQNSGCPFPTKHVEVRNTAPFAGSLSASWIHLDKNILCGNRSVIWIESSVLFPLDAIPSDFTSAHLEFTSAGSAGQFGTEAGFLASLDHDLTPGVNCIKAIHSYHVILHDNAQDPDRQGDPNAYFGYVKESLIATSADSAPGAVNSFDVTALVKQSLAKGKKNLGFVWEVDRAMHADNDLCAAPFHSVVLEIHQ